MGGWIFDFTRFSIMPGGAHINLEKVGIFAYLIHGPPASLRREPNTCAEMWMRSGSQQQDTTADVPSTLVEALGSSSSPLVPAPVGRDVYSCCSSCHVPSESSSLRLSSKQQHQQHQHPHQQSLQCHRSSQAPAAPASHECAATAASEETKEVRYTF